MALLVLDSVVNVSDAGDRLVKVMDELNDFVSKMYKNSFKQRSNPTLRNNENKHRSNFDKHEHFLRALPVLIVFHYVIGVYKINNEKNKCIITLLYKRTIGYNVMS
jgi:hypothetical protein